MVHLAISAFLLGAVWVYIIPQVLAFLQPHLPHSLVSNKLIELLIVGFVVMVTLGFVAKIRSSVRV